MKFKFLINSLSLKQIYEFKQLADIQILGCTEV